MSMQASVRRSACPSASDVAAPNRKVRQSVKAKTMLQAVAATAAAVLVAAGIAVVTAGPAEAQTGGIPDGTSHPNVGLILFYEPDGRFRCSATLIEPTVVITAAHCTAG